MSPVPPPAGMPPAQFVKRLKYANSSASTRSHVSMGMLSRAASSASQYSCAQPAVQLPQAGGGAAETRVAAPRTQLDTCATDKRRPSPLAITSNSTPTSACDRLSEPRGAAGSSEHPDKISLMFSAARPKSMVLPDGDAAGCGAVDVPPAAPGVVVHTTQTLPFMLGEVIGRGAVGTVYVVMDKETRRLMAAKRIPITRKLHMESLSNEVRLLRYGHARLNDCLQPIWLLGRCVCGGWVD